MASARVSLLALRRIGLKGPDCTWGSLPQFCNKKIYGGHYATTTTATPPIQTTTCHASPSTTLPLFLLPRISSSSSSCGSTSMSSRYFSSASPNQKKSMLRMHAVSLYQADYNDDTDDNAAWKDEPPAVPHLNPTERRKAEEEEEATWWLYDGTQESRDALEAMREKEAQKRRWIQNAKSPVRLSEIDERGRAYGRGSRKSAHARVWVQPGEGELVVNRKDFVTYFPRESNRDHILGPMVASQTCGLFDVVAMVRGGGMSGQAGAIRLGLARALEKYNPDYRPSMKRHGFMTRDPRKVERKKVGRVKARKSPQWVRR